MIVAIATWLIARNPALTLGHAKRLAKIGLIAVAVVLLIGGFLVWDHFDDEAAVRTSQLESERDTAVTTLESERRANAGDQARAEARATASQQTQDELETIHAEDPEAAASPASRGARAVAGRLPRS